MDTIVLQRLQILFDALLVPIQLRVVFKHHLNAKNAHLECIAMEFLHQMFQLALVPLDPSANKEQVFQIQLTDRLVTYVPLLIIALLVLTTQCRAPREHMEIQPLLEQQQMQFVFPVQPNTTVLI